MNKNNTDKEYIVQTIEETIKGLDFNIGNQFMIAMSNMNDDIKNNPITCAILAASIAQANAIEVMTEVLLKILNE